MTEMPPHTPPPPPPKRLTRTRDDRMIAGVAAGLGRHFELDPLLFRVGFAVLTLFGGSGLLLYVLLALLVPSDATPAGAPADNRSRTLLVIAGVIVAVVVLPIALPGAFFLSPLIVLAAIGILIYRAAGGSVDPRAARASAIVLAIVAAIGLGFGAAAAVAFGGGTIVSGVVLAAGLVLVIGSFFGGMRWLIAPALILAIPVAIVSAANIDLEGGVGEREYRPAAVGDLRSEYRLGVGDLRIDLSGVDFPSGTTTIRTDVGIGHIELELPDDVCLDSDVHIGMGHADLLDRESDGVDVDVEHRETIPSGASILRLQADIGMGEIEVDRGDDGYFASTDPVSCTP